MKKGKVRGDFKKLYIEEVPASYSTLKIFRLIKSISKSWDGECSVGKKRNAYKCLVAKR
jgi:hypothetical protein